MDVNERKYEYRAPRDLASHPAQDESFLPLTDDERSQLQQSMVTHGQRDLVEITSEGVIIDGHNRVHAAIELEWESIRVWVRDDLDDRQAESRAIDANLERRQIGQLGQLRAETRKLEIERRLQPGTLTRQHSGATEALAEALKMSQKNLGRLWKLVRGLPPSLQQAVDQGKLKKCLATKLCDLDSYTRKFVAAEVEAGGDPNTVASAYVPVEVKKQPTKRQILLHFCKAALPMLRIRLRSLRTGLSVKEICDLLAVVTSLETFLPTLRQHLEQAFIFEQAGNARFIDETRKTLLVTGLSELAEREGPHE